MSSENRAISRRAFLKAASIAGILGGVSGGLATNTVLPLSVPGPQGPAGPGGGAPTGARYVVTELHPDLTAEELHSNTGSPNWDVKHDWSDLLPGVNPTVGDYEFQGSTSRAIGAYGVGSGIKVKGPTTGRWNVARARNAGGEVLDIMAVDDTDGLSSQLWRKAAASSLMDYSTHIISSSRFAGPGSGAGGFGHYTIGGRLTPTAAMVPAFASVPMGLQSVFEVVASKVWGYREKNAGIQSYGMPPLIRILEGTGAGVVLFSPEFATYTTGNVSGNRSGVQTSSFNLTRGMLSENMWFGCKFMIPVTTNIRIWIGLTSANLGSIDDPAVSGIDFLGLRYSTGAGDTTLQAVFSDSTTLTLESIAGALSTTLIYYLFIQSNKNSGESRIVVFKGASAFETSTIDPSSGTPVKNLGFHATAETLTNATKTFRLSHIEVMEE